MSLCIHEIASRIAASEPPGELQTTVLYHTTLPVDVDAADEQGRTPIIFVPDLHLLSDERARGYGEYFHLNQKQKPLLLHLLSALIHLRATEFPRLKVYQLGDMHDLWREAAHWWGEDAPAMLARQLQSHQDLFKLLWELDTERLVGNHDRALRSDKVRAALANAPISGFLLLDDLHPDFHSFLWGVNHRVDLLHSDQVDDAETPWYRQPINPIGARFAEHGGLVNLGEVDEWAHELTPPGDADPALFDPTTAIGDSAAQELLQPTVVFSEATAEDRHAKFFAALRELDTCSIDASIAAWQADRVAVVIGHTHDPRIVVDGTPATLTLMDCGSWVNVSPLTNDPNHGFFWNRQIGVLSGRDAAVLQIGSTYETLEPSQTTQ
jgi:UDP-2,3-diacylglucosamine pyrophosphatase LpxH